MADVTKFLRLVLDKYPDAEHWVGSDSGAEEQIRTALAVAGKKVTVPEVYTYLDGAKLLQVCNVIEHADVVVLIGTPGGGRVKLAKEILKRIDTCREEWNKRHVHSIGIPVSDKPRKARATKQPTKKQKMARDLD